MSNALMKLMMTATVEEVEKWTVSLPLLPPSLNQGIAWEKRNGLKVEGMNWWAIDGGKL
jgi:hypothetical protein